MPLGRIMAAMMLASLISTLFALPASAAVSTITNVGSAPFVLPSAAYSYTVVVTNGATPDTSVTVTDTVATASIVGTPAWVTSAPIANGTCTAGATFTCAIGNLAANQTATITINVTAPASGTATNNASVVSTGTPLPGVVATPATTTVQNADLVVTKAHAGVTTPGGALTYTITVLNNGPDTATGVTLHDAAPTGITFGTVTVASSPLGGPAACSAASPTVMDCAGWTIPNGTTVTVTVPATLSLTATGSIGNTASITPPAATPDSNLVNNSATDTFAVGAVSVDLGVAIAVAPTAAAPGDKVTYTATVTNPNTTTDATNVVVTDALPAGLTAVTPPTAPSSGTVAVAGSTWTWTIPTVAKATSATTPTVVTASFDAVVDPTTTLTTITNTATMTATQTDPVSTNNTASVDLTIAAAVADLNLLSAVDNPKPNKGDKIQIGIQVSNAGPADATNVVVEDVLANGLKYDSCTGCGPSGVRRSTSQQFSIASIPASSSATIVLNVTVQANSGTLKNTASILSADQSDPNGANDKDTLNITIGGTNSSGGGGTGTGAGTGTGTGSTPASGGTTAFTGFTANQLLPWLMLFATLGLVALEFARRRPAVAAVGHTYGFDPWV
jgi:uncharacterized repeat protein (TIGR01451 family)